MTLSVQFPKMAGPLSSMKSCATCAVAPRFRILAGLFPRRLPSNHARTLHLSLGKKKTIMHLHLCGVPVENSGPPAQTQTHTPSTRTPGPRPVRSQFPASPASRLSGLIGSAQPARPRKRRTPTLSSPASPRLPLLIAEGRRTRGPGAASAFARSSAPAWQLPTNSAVTRQSPPAAPPSPRAPPSRGTAPRTGQSAARPKLTVC